MKDENTEELVGRRLKAYQSANRAGIETNINDYFRRIYMRSI